MTAALPKLPPLHISKIYEIPSWELHNSNETTSEQKINYVLRNLSLISEEAYSSFEPLNQRTIHEYQVHSYHAVAKNQNSIFGALGEEIDELEDSGHHEFLVFLFRNTVSEWHRLEDVFVLSTNKAYKILHPFCSVEFPIQSSTKLARDLIRIEEILTSQLHGPIAESQLRLQETLPTTVEQRGLVCREFTAIFRSFMSCIESDQIKIKFKEKGIVLYRSFSLDHYVDIVAALSKSENTIGAPIHEWSIPTLPQEFTVITNRELSDTLDEYILKILTEEANLPHDWKVELRLSERWYSNADEYRIDCTVYATESKGGKHSFTEEFEDPFSPPGIEQIKEILQKCYKADWIYNKHYLRAIILRKEIYIQHKKAGFWYQNPLIDCLEGRVEGPQNQVYFKMGASWYQLPVEYIQRVNNAFIPVAQTCALTNNDVGYLHLPWSCGQNEPAYNRSYIAHSTQAKVWYDGNNRTAGVGVEMFDILLSTQEDTFIYHSKKKFDHTIRDAATQLIMSAQTVRNSIDRGGNIYVNSNLYRYCDTVAKMSIHNTGIHNRAHLLDSFVNKKLHFVIAFPVDWYSMINSGSVTAQREIIRAKKEIEELGFIFKISLVQKDW